MSIKDNFDKIVKIVEEGATQAAEKSEDMIESAKISFTISSNDEEIKRIYEKIGEKMYTEYKNGSYYDSILGYCEEIDLILKSIQKLEKKKKKIKHKNICPNCDMGVDAKCKFCPQCGQKL